jgi:hypothetical protein
MQLMSSKFFQIQEEQGLLFNTLSEFFTRPDFYSAPRQIVLGASLEF